MKKKANMCKFVTALNEKSFKTINFVYESAIEFSNMPVTRKNHCINIVTGGNGRLCSEHFEKSLEAGMVFFTFANIAYTIKNDNNLQYMYISFTGNESQALFDRFKVTYNNCIFSGFENLLSFWQNALEKSNETNLDLISESVILYTLSQFSIPERTKQHITDDIIEYIEDNFDDCNLSLQTVAEEFGYNSKYISRTFKENVGVTFSEYLKNTRIKHAVFLLEQNITSVKNVAFLSGYSDPLYFSNIFKKSLGISPSDFIGRKRQREQQA